jgi:mRNA-degrading endonuclease YafQ of YafQ-DinJ toxin-antitoxin module
MKIAADESFDEDYARLPRPIQERVDKQLALLLKDPRHPSLRTRKMEGHRDLWEGHVTKEYCFTFRITGDTYRLRRVGTHGIYRQP